MKKLFVVISVACSFTLMSLSYVSANEPDASAFVKDSVITTKIKAQLAKENLPSLKNLNVDTDNAGAVWLRGTAVSDEEAKRAVAIALSTDGVTKVNSDIQVKPKQ
jgi:hyperosmotically inducible protein